MKRRIVLYCAFVVIASFTLLPFIWFALTSWKQPAEVTAIPPVLALHPHWGFYRSAIQEYGLLKFIANSALVAGLTTLLSIGIGSLAAFALARFSFGWSRVCLMTFLAISMFPQVAIAGPVWRILDSLGWLNSRHGLIAVYVALSIPLAVWILTTFFKELPEEIEEAALIDGCTRFQVLHRVVLPLAAPGLFTAAILVFINAWNEFFFALLILSNPALQTLPVGIALFPGEYTMPWGEISAASNIATFPVVIMVLLLQRRIVRGLSAGAVKG